MNALRGVLCATLGLTLSLLQAPRVEAWQLRGGGGARTFVVPHGGATLHPRPPMPQPAPPPTPYPGPQPHPYPPPPPHPPPHPEPNPPYPGPGPQPVPRPPAPPPGPPPPPPDDWYHPWAAAAVVGATTATVIAIGTRVDSVPPDCVSVIANGMAYQHCGATWYQPHYVGSSVQFIVVAAPW